MVARQASGARADTARSAPDTGLWTLAAACPAGVVGSTPVHARDDDVGEPEGQE